MKYIGIAGVLIVIIAIFLVSEKLYPVAIVNGSPIGERTWERYLNGVNHALILQAQRDNQRFDIDADTLALLEKSTLTALIEDRIIAQNAAILIPEFTQSSEQYITMAIGTSTTLGKAAQFMYGFGEKDFHDFVLLPESRREVVRLSLIHI